MGDKKKYQSDCLRCGGSGQLIDQQDYYRGKIDCTRCGGSGKAPFNVIEGIVGFTIVGIITLAVIGWFFGSIISLISGLFSGFVSAVTGIVSGTNNEALNNLDYIQYVTKITALSGNGAAIATFVLFVIVVALSYIYWSRIVKEEDRIGLPDYFKQKTWHLIIGLATSIPSTSILLAMFPAYKFLYFYAFAFFSIRLAKLNGISIVLYIAYMMLAPIVYFIYLLVADIASMFK